ncbi:polygalacturonase ADPG1-like [Vigna unguiculata]|uniref:polygalacturonase ADPG1-like n=1 Tax=Vigna unguiculata TaxID=3917 RepID=UPI0010171C3C|nr:polygalacturonase ADPG1-like [Vigna unguiculata]
MQRLIIFLFILGFISPCLCARCVKTEEKENTYNVIDYGAHGDGKSDDSKAFVSAWKETCGTKGTSTLIIPENRVFLVKGIALNGPCSATKINIRVQHVNNLSIDGSGGSIDGYGSSWWKCESCGRPTILRFKSCKDLSVSHVSITNSPKAHIRINNCENARISHINIDSPGDSPNTDGIDIYSSKNIFIEDSTIQCGDDCIAISDGSSYINATRIACGPGHGISIGSLGRDGSYETVTEVNVKNCSFSHTTNGARIKTAPGGSGYAKHISFEDIKLTQVENPIIIDQYYGSKHSKVLLTFDEAINLNCCPPGCFNLVLDNIDIVSSKPGKPVSCSCNNAHGKVTSTHPNCSFSYNQIIM